MSLCLNPNCGSDQNPAHSIRCRSCGSPLRLKQKYRSLKLLGQGGFGQTFLAVDETQSHKPRCVIKQFLPSDRPERFRQEAQKLATLGQHSQIPQLLDYVEEGSSTYLVQEFIEGQTLEQALTDQGPLSPEEILSILHELLPVLHTVHQKQIIHRDIKPANLIQPKSGKLCLVDFGAAKTLTGTRLAQTGTIIGSACFAAPEQAIGKAIYASDIYSLGVTCIYLLTHVSPFTLYDISEGQWVWQDYLTQSVSSSLSKVLNKMLIGATKYRYASCAEVLQDLEGTPRPKNSRPPRPARSVSSPAATPKTAAMAASSCNSAQSQAEQITQPDLPTIKCELTTVLKGHTQAINAVALSPNRQHIATAGSDGYLRLWSMAAGQTRKVLLEGEVGALDTLDFSPDGELIAAGGWDGVIRVWRTVSGAEVCKLNAHEGTINTLKFSPNGQWLASGGYDGNLYLWKKQISQRLFWTSVVQFEAVEVMTNPHEGWVTRLAFSSDSQRLASVGWNGTTKVWRPKTGNLVRTLDHDGVMMQSVAFHPNSRILATAGGKDRALTLWDGQTGERIKTLAGKSFVFTQAEFISEGRQVLGACSDGQLRLLNVDQGGGCAYRVVAHSKSIHALAIRGQTIVTGGADRMAKIWMLQQSV